MERRKWFCETHHMWFNESCELCERSSPESGGRRQEAENDHGSEWSSEYHATEICTLFGHGHFDKVVEYLDKLRNEVSARSADSPSVDHPPHYTEHPSGVECIAITEHFNFCLGNAIKYIWRAGLKGDAVEDLKKARWYIDRELKNRDMDSSR